MLPAFQLHLHQPILERVAQVGKFDGKHPSLVCGTLAGKVFIHSPHETLLDSNTTGITSDATSSSSSSSNANVDGSSDTPRVRYLKINRKVSALATGKFDPSDAGDTLVVGTQASLLAYNVDQNSDVFYKDVPDGVNALVFSPAPVIRGHAHRQSRGSSTSISSSESPSANMVVAGGNCSLQGFARSGDEVYWTVTGDNVRALARTDFSGNGRDELVVGSDDYAIRSFQGEDLIHEITETAQILALTPLQKPQLLGYALDNGTVGVYHGKRRAWRVKSKNKPTAIHAFDLDGDGEPEIVIGWNNGKFEARRLANGDVACKDMLTAPIAAIVAADYRMDGIEEIICCANNGEIRGYTAADRTEMAAQVTNDRAASEENEVSQLSKQKAAMQSELKALETSNSGSSTARKSGGSSTLRIRAGTRVEVKSISTQDSTSMDLEISTDREYVIRAVVLFDYDAGVFEGESRVFRPPPNTNTPFSVVVPLQLTKYSPVTLDLKILLGVRGNASAFHVVEMQHVLPKFAMFVQLPTAPTAIPQGSVRFRSPVKAQFIWSWLTQAFTVTQATADSGEFEAYFRCLKDRSTLAIIVTTSETIVRTDDMALAAEIVQDMCTCLVWRDLESLAEFPRQMDEFRALLLRVDECNAIRLKLTGEMADDSNQIKNLVIRVEDARALNDMSRLRRYYSELFTLNNQLLGEYTKRSTNHQALLDALKDVNAMIQLAARLRFGTPKTSVIAACRKAIKQNNIHALFYIVKTGKEEHP